MIQVGKLRKGFHFFQGLNAESVPDLIKNADTAMYHAKEMGKNNYQFFSEDINTKAREKVELETKLSLAILRKELVMYYQPLVNSITNEIFCLEALIRWKHPKLGMVPPSKFILLIYYPFLFQIFLQSTNVSASDLATRVPPEETLEVPP